MKQLIKKISSLIVLLVLLFSCVSREKLVYLNDTELISNENLSVEVKLEIDDLLLIHVLAKDIESVAPFNLESLMVPTASSSNVQRQQQLYLIDNDGYINFPILGRLKLAGLKRSEVVNLLTEKLTVFVQDPIISLRIMNYKISVLGEVSKPGVYTINSERVNVLEALSRAGDLTIYGNRKEVLLIREVDGKKTSVNIDLTSVDFINSKYYYLKQNDIIYVEPNKTKINSSVVGANTSVIISALSLLLTVVALVIK